MTHTNEIRLQKGIDYELLNKARIDQHKTFEYLEEITRVSKDTIKNILNGKTKNPGVESLNPICEELGVSIQQVLRQSEKTEIENRGIKVDDASVLALKEIYELQISTLKETSEAHISNIRSHYEQHHEDLKENYEKRLSDKREIIDTQLAHIKSLEKECRHTRVFSWICVSVLVALLIAEVMNPNLGWLRY